ncbi:hypothetical protein JB92DRAFT_2753228 [Gautieria morchelliformis]|nr:hypothetical protein JB92DRAFT_2753228 [Gautieria morchelliformis]
MKAAKYYSESAEGFGPWNLLLSSRAIQHLKGYHRDQKVWNIIKKKMQELSQGFFSDSNQKLLIGNDNDVPIYEAKLSRDLRIIYQIDIAPEDGTRNDIQVIRLWGIHTHAQMDRRLWKSICQHHTRIGREYRRRCLFRATPKHPGSNVIYPYSWSSAVQKIPVEPAAATPMSTNEQLEVKYVLHTMHYAFRLNFMLPDIIADQDAAYPFELTGAEQEIRDHQSSCFVLGRSGTGKTTTMVFKMMNYEMLRMQQATQKVAVLPGRPLRQLFVTQSRILVGRVQEYFMKMMMSHTAGHKTPQELERLAQRNQLVKQGEEMPDLDDEDEERADLPKKFSELEDHHFPLFLTVDQLYKLLEADCDLSFKRLSHSPTAGTVSQKASIVTFDVFKYGYWPHFPQPLTKGLDPGLVYNELLGAIKGSEETLDGGNGNDFLQKETYLNLSERRQSTFSRQRERIYELFDHYRQLKSDRGDYDAADRTHAILRALVSNMPPKWKVDYLYVDEAQDNLIIDAQLLKLLCGNPHGLFWAGGMLMGSSFRFDDLKSFIYRIEVRLPGFMEKSSPMRTPVHPASFQLDINYRSHAGVVNCAHSIVELITRFWPHSIDTLARERGLVDGPLPVFFSGWDPEATSYEQFLFHESLHIELGAQQCILVRDDRARENLRRQIGEVGLIMTLYEAKGLEFNDVLLYNFFTDSMAALPEWRVVLNVVEDGRRGHISAPRFDDSRHALLCSELKSLYVGITRARSQVWILDTTGKGEPMRIFWESQELIQLCRPGDPQPKLAVKSTPEQWAQQGHALFKTSHFKQAMFCFERASLSFERSVAYAYLLRQAAQRAILQHGHKESTIGTCIQAAESFVVCAGISTSIVKKRKYLTLAAEWYSSGSQFSQAAQAYINAGRFTKAAQHFKRAGLYDEAADVVLHHHDEVDRKVAEQCLSIAKLHLHREGQLLKAARLFDDIEDHLLYLEDFGFDNARLTLLQQRGRWADAAELLYEQRQHLEAIPLWLRDNDLGSKRRACQCLLDSLWKTLPLGADTNIGDSLRDTLLELLHTLDEYLDETQREESTAFILILKKNTGQLLDLARASYRTPKSNHMVALLCFDHILCQPPRMHNDNAKCVSRYLEDYDMYGQLMRAVIIDWKQAHAARLLGLAEVVGESTVGIQEFHVLSTSVLHEYLRDGTSSDDNGIIISADRLPGAIRFVLGQRMMHRLSHEHDVCLHTRAFRPCINMAVTGACHRPTCPHDHLLREAHDLESFNLRMRLHMQQILIVHRMGIDHDDRDTERGLHRMRRIWLERLHDVAFPTFYAFGHVSALLANSIPEYQKVKQILSGWIRHRFYSLRPYHRDEDKFLMEVTHTAALAFAFDRDNATHYIRRADCIVLHRPPILVYENRGYMVHDLINFFEAEPESETLPESSIIRGASFIKRVLDRRIPVDINALLNVVESVLARAIIASRRSLHDLTLPRSWILSWLSTWDGRCAINYDTRVLQILFEPLEQLLGALWSRQGAEHIEYDRRPISSAPIIAINVLIYRICRCVTLLGYNSRSSQYGPKETIVRMVSSLNKAGIFYPPLVAPYVKAEQWKDLARALRSSSPSPLDELIVMRKNGMMPTTYHPPRGIKMLRYDIESDIPTNAAYKNTSKFNPEAAPFVPSLAQPASVHIPEEDLPAEEPSDAGSEVDESLNETVHVEVVPNDPSVHRTVAEVDAAKVFQKWYRRRLAFKSKLTTVISQFRSQMFIKSLTQSDKLDVSLQYRLMFLGPLPHILTALHGCGTAVQKTKSASLKRLLSDKSFNLERENELVTICNRLRNKKNSLWKDVEPTSGLHRHGSSSDLKERVEEINKLFQDASRVTPDLEELARELEVGYKGIVRVAAPPRPRPTARNVQRPSLNTEDLDL